TPAASDASKQEMLAMISEEVDRMDRSIEEAVRLARMEANELSLHKHPENLALLIPAAVDAMGTLISGREICVCVPESLPLAECDKGMMLRVFKQLLNNAATYSPQGTPLEVTAELTGSAIVVDVVDRGPGIAEDERDRI